MLMICALLLQNFVVVISALFPPVLLGKKQSLLTFSLLECMDETMTIDGIDARFWERFEDFWEILEANGELMGDCGNKGVAVARLSLTNPHIPNLSLLQNQSQHLSWTYPTKPSMLASFS